MEFPKVFCVQNCIVTKTILSILQSLSGRKINMYRTIYLQQHFTIYLQQYFTLCGLNDQFGPAWVWATNLVPRIGTHHIVLNSFESNLCSTFSVTGQTFFFVLLCDTSSSVVHFTYHTSFYCRQTPLLSGHYCPFATFWSQVTEQKSKTVVSTFFFLFTSLGEVKKLGKPPRAMINIRTPPWPKGQKEWKSRNNFFS